MVEYNRELIDNKLFSIFEHSQMNEIPRKITKSEKIGEN